MRIGIILILVCLFAGIAVNAQQQPAQDEVRMLNIEVVRLFNANKYEEALQIAESSLKLCEQSFGKDNPKTMDSLKNLAAVYAVLDQNEKSADTYKRIVKMQEEQVGKNDKSLINILVLMGNQYLIAKKGSAALSAYDHALKIADVVYEKDSKELIPILKRTSFLYVNAANVSKSIDHYKRLIALQEKHLGPEHLETAESLDFYSMVLRMTGKIKEAGEYDEKIRCVYRLVHLPDNTRISSNDLHDAAIYKAEPVYPSIAKSNRIQGAVYMQVTIDEGGLVIKAIPVSGPKDLIDTSITAVKKWRFRPIILEGKPVKVQGILVFNYTIMN